MMLLHDTKYFNPRSREGSDVFPCPAHAVFGISIHAPAKGATKCNVNEDWLRTDFNPRSREGSDQLDLLVWLSTSNFNPRSREGSDSRTVLNRIVLVAFQSTLPRRERPWSVVSLLGTYRFQSTLPRRERRQYYTTNFIFFV